MQIRGHCTSKGQYRKLRQQGFSRCVLWWETRNLLLPGVNIGFKLLNRIIEEQSTSQSTHFFCKNYLGKHNGSVLWRNKWYMKQLNQTKTHPMTKCIQADSKNHPKFSSKVMEKQSTRFICILELTKETEWQCTFNKWMMYGVVGANTNSF